MAELIYDGAHSIDIRVEDDEDVWRNTWETWKLAPSSRPIVNPPEPKKEYVDVPGADGSLDYTEALSKVKYQNRSGSWNFLIDNSYWDWPTLYTEFMQRYQGRLVQIVLKDDPEYYYRGRIEINQFNQAKDFSSFTINYILEPFKWPILSSKNLYWKWNELFGIPALFGPILVDGDVERCILNPDNQEEQPVYACATDTVLYDMYRYQNKTLVKETQGENPYYSLVGDGLIDYTFTEVTNPSGNPKNQNYCERESDGSGGWIYYLTLDTIVDPGKTYYTYTGTTVPVTMRWYERSGTTGGLYIYTATSDQVPLKGKEYYEQVTAGAEITGGDDNELTLITTLKPGEVKLLVLHGRALVKLDLGTGKRL